MNRGTALVFVAVIALFLAAPALAQEDDSGDSAGIWDKPFAAIGIAIAAAGGAAGQGKTAAAAISAIARNPSATADIRLSMILGLVLIESLVIYALVIALLGVGLF